MRVVHRNLGAALEAFFVSEEGPFHLICPFISIRVLETLLTRHRVHTIYTSWRADHLLSGHSSLDLYPLARQQGVNLVVCDRVHAKVFTNYEFSRAFIGSANLTARGLGQVAGFNLEAAVVCEDDSREVRGLVSAIMVAGTFVDDRVYAIYRSWFAENSRARPSAPSVPGPIVLPTRFGPWLLAQLPATESPRALWDAVNIYQADDDNVLHDLALLGGDLTGSRRVVYERMRSALSENAFFCSIVQEVRQSEDGLHFGGMKALIQSRCANIPMPHRRELIEIVQNIYRWLTELFPEEFEVVRPRYSEVIRRRRAVTVA